MGQKRKRFPQIVSTVSDTTNDQLFLGQSYKVEAYFGQPPPFTFLLKLFIIEERDFYQLWQYILVISNPSLRIANIPPVAAIVAISSVHSNETSPFEGVPTSIVL